MQPSLPPLVRAWFPGHIGFATAVYTNGLLVGEILAVALTIPFVLPLVHDSWRLTLVLWSVPVWVTALLVIACAPRQSAVTAAEIPHHSPLAGESKVGAWWPDWGDPLIWRLGLIFGSVNTMYFVTNAFLPDYVIAAGRPDLVGSALTALNGGQLPASLLMLPLAGRLVTRPWAYVATGLLALFGVVGIMGGTGLWIVVCSGLLGFAGAVTLILVLALPSILSAPGDVPRISAGMFTISYSCAMIVSVAAGWLWDATHAPVAGFALVALGGLVIVVLAPTVRRADRQPAVRE